MKSKRLLDDLEASYIPNFAVFAFANEDNTVRVDVISSTSSFAFLAMISIMILRTFGIVLYFSSRYSSPKLTRAVSYSRTAASEVTEGGFEMISLYCISAFRGSVFASFFASTILADSAGAMLISFEGWCDMLLSTLLEALLVLPRRASAPCLFALLIPVSICGRMGPL
jgi:hypothetical protein